MKFLVQNYSCRQNPRLGGYRSRIHVFSLLCPQLNLLNPTPNKIPGYATGYHIPTLGRRRRKLRNLNGVQLIFTCFECELFCLLQLPIVKGSLSQMCNCHVPWNPTVKNRTFI